MVHLHAALTSALTALLSASAQVLHFREDPDKVPAIVLGLSRFYNSRTFSDLTIITPDGHKVLVHQVVLAACSKRFSDVLESGKPRCISRVQVQRCTRGGQQPTTWSPAGWMY